MYLNDFSATSFKELANYLVENEGSSPVEGQRRLRYIDISEPGKPGSREHQIQSGRKGDTPYVREIKPFLGLKDCQFRVRSDVYDQTSSWDSSIPNTLKVTRLDVGYIYVDPLNSWYDPTNPDQQEENDDRFENALKLLYGRDKAQPMQLRIELGPGHDPIDIDRSQELIQPLSLLETIVNITRSSPISSAPNEPVPYCYSAEIFVHEIGQSFVHPSESAAVITPPTVQPEEHTEAQWALLTQQLEEHKYNEGQLQLERDTLTEVVSDMEREQETLVSTVAGQLGQFVYLGNEFTILRDRALGAEGERDALRGRIADLEMEILRTKLDRDVARADCERLRLHVPPFRNQAQGSARESIQPRAQVHDKEQQTDAAQVHDQEQQTDVTQVHDQEQQTDAQEPERQPLQVQFTNQDFAAPTIGADEASPESPEPQDAASAAPAPPGGPDKSKTLLYCMVCLTSVDKMSDNVRNRLPLSMSQGLHILQNRNKHADKCSTTTSTFAPLTMQEAKRLRAERKAEADGQAGPKTQQKRKRDDSEDEQSEGESTKKPKRAAAVRASTRMIKASKK